MSEFKPLTGDQLKLLAKPLPTEAVSPHPTKSYLSTIKAIYVVERLNEVFGVGRWSMRGVNIVESSEKMVVVETEFSAPEYGIRLWAYGGNDNVDRGDAYKGAVTDGLTKIGSFLGIGMDVFKGLHDKKNGRPEKPKAQATEYDDSAIVDKAIAAIDKARNQKDLDKIVERARVVLSEGTLTQASFDFIESQAKKHGLIIGEPSHA